MNKFIDELSAAYDAMTSSGVVLVESALDDYEISELCIGFSKKKSGAAYLYGEASSPYPFLVPYRPLLYAIYCSRPLYSDFREIDINKVERLSLTLGISAAENRARCGIFNLIKSFYGYKHQMSDLFSMQNLRQEIINVLLFILEKNDAIIFHVSGASDLDADTAELIKFICDLPGFKKIFFIISYDSDRQSSAKVSQMFSASIVKELKIGLPRENCHDGLYAALANFDDDSRKQIGAAAIFFNDFRACDFAYAIGRDEPAALASVENFIKEGFLYETAYAGYYRFRSRALRERALALNDRETVKGLNKKLSDAYIEKSSLLPAIGLNRLIYHAINAGDYDAAVRFALLLSEPLCELGCISGALKLVRFVELFVFPHAALEKNVNLRLKTYIAHAKILILKNNHGAAFAILSRVLKKIDAAQSDPEVLRSAYEANMWLGFLALIKPALACGEPEYAMSVLARAFKFDAGFGGRIEITNLIALWHYQRSDMEKSSIFYKDSLKALAMNKNSAGAWLENDSALRGISSVFLRQGEIRKAVAYLKKCEEGCARVNNKKMLAGTYHYMGMLHHGRGEYSLAISNYERALEITNEISDGISASRIWTSFGVTLFNLAKYDESLSYFNKSLDMAFAASNKKAVAILKGNIARIFAIKGDIDKALLLLNEDIQILEQTNDAFGFAYAYAYTGDVYFMKKKIDAACVYYLKAYELSKKSQFLRPLILSAMGLLSCVPSHYSFQDSKKLIDEMILIDAREIDAVSKSLILKARGVYETLCGTYHRATCFVNQASINFEKMQMPFETAMCLIDEANILKLNGLSDEAEAKRRSAAKIFSGIGAVHYLDEYGR